MSEEQECTRPISIPVPHASTPVHSPPRSALRLMVCTRIKVCTTLLSVPFIMRVHEMHLVHSHLRRALRCMVCTKRSVAGWCTSCLPLTALGALVH